MAFDGARPSCSRPLLSENSSFCRRSTVFQLVSVVVLRSACTRAVEIVEPGPKAVARPSWKVNQPATPESLTPRAAASAFSSVGWPCA
ncbi:hypothetical protein D3C72_2099730 [compost metagenome]